jgi:hypothetical protein
MEQMDLATKWAMATKEELVASSENARVRDILLLAKVLISQVGKEEARRLIGKAQYDMYYQMGREAAERLGNPQELDSFVEEYFVRQMGKRVLVPPTVFVERTKTRCVCRTPSCVLADAFMKIAHDPSQLARFGGDALEVAKARCDHDAGWANGFNPKMKFKRTKFLLHSDDCCEFVAEL